MTGGPARVRRCRCRRCRCRAMRAAPAAWRGCHSRRCGRAALERAEALGCSHAEVRVEQIRSQFVALRDGRVETTVDDTEIGRRAARGARGLHRVRGHGGAQRRCRRRRSPTTPPAWPPRRRPPSGTRVEMARRARPRRRAVVLALRGRPDGGAAGRQGGAPRGLEPPAHGVGRASTTSPPGCSPSWRTSTTPTCRAR